MKTTDFDAVLSSAPNSATAAKVTSKGTHYEPSFNASARDTLDMPPAMKHSSEFTHPDALATYNEMVGSRTGRLTVLGIATGNNKKKNARWVVRCDCGKYEFRKARALRNPANSHDRCTVCAHVRAKRLQYDRYGARPLSDFISPKKQDTGDE